MDAGLITKSIGYHGLPLQKIWEGERGNGDLQRCGVTNPDFSVYSARQPSLPFQDRAKRLKLHQFIAKKASELFDSNFVDEFPKQGDTDIHLPIKDTFVVMPPIESLLNFDQKKRLLYFFENIQPGDLVYGQVVLKTNNGITVKVQCTTGSAVRYVCDIGAIKATIPVSNLVPPIDRKNLTRGYQTGDLVCCEVLEITPDSCRLVCGMRNVYKQSADDGTPLGLISADNFPESYKLAKSKKGLRYNQILEKSPAFNNPSCIDNLLTDLGLDPNEFPTIMSGLKGRFPQKEYAIELRQAQASKWAFRSVAEGIEHFKEGRHAEAFQCLNKALSIDARNVEGLVARGALYANSGSFKKAVDDFETALKLNPSHANARKYMGETLVALGRSFEEENKIEEAKKAYQDCLAIIPHHEEAQHSLDYLKNKANSSGKPIVEPGELVLPVYGLNKSLEGTSRSHSEAKKDKRSSKKDRKKKVRKRRDSSDSSSDSSDSSSDSSESSSVSDSSSSSDSEANVKKKKKRKSRQRSLSPLSKRMALMSESKTAGDIGYQFNQSAYGQPQLSAADEYELKVRKFLEMQRDEDDYEEKVRKFVAEASKHQEKHSKQDDKSSKKKKKEKERKGKKDSKKKKKRDSKKSKKEKLGLEESESKKIREALKIFESLPVLDELGSKLTEYYAKIDTKKEEKSAKSPPKLSSGKPGSSKWKMMFSKDERKTMAANLEATHQMVAAPQKLAKPIPKQYAFVNDSDSDGEKPNFGAPKPNMMAATTSKQAVQQHSPRRSPRRSSPRHESRNRRKVSPPAVPPPVRQGPIVLDKFGCFRLAAAPTTGIQNAAAATSKPPEPPGRPRSKGRSSSRSTSRSPRRRRSRSRSFGRRRFSRSRSRSRGSYRRSRSYSRSRSGSMDRRVRPFRGRGFFNNRYNNRFQHRGRGRGFRDMHYRGSRGRPYFNGPRRYDQHDRRPSRSLSGSPIRQKSSLDRELERIREKDRELKPQKRDRSGERRSRGEKKANSVNIDSKKDDTNDVIVVTEPIVIHEIDLDSSAPDVEGRWADDKLETSIDKKEREEMDKILDKSRNEKREEMIERNKDLVKKNTPIW